MNQKLSTTLIFLFILQCLRSQATNLTCTPEMVESYGIISHNQAKKERLVFCPQIAYSCCPAYEQFKMFKTYSESVKPGFILLNELIKKELTLLRKEVLDLLAKGTIEGAIEGLADEAVKRRVAYVYSKIKNKRPKIMFDKIWKYQKVSSSYVAAWKSAFFCTICDFANQEFININKKTITFSGNSCDALVKNTLMFASLLNSVLVPYLSALTEVITRLGGTAKYQKLHNHRRVIKAIKDCAADYKQYDQGLGNCKNYCEMFNFAQDNYILEGYPEFFANTLVEIRLFAKPGQGAGDSGSPPARSLIEKSVRDLIRKTKQQNRKLLDSPSETKYFQPSIGKKHKKFTEDSGRILEEEEIYNEEEVMEAENLDTKIGRKRLLQESSRNTDWSQDNLDPKNNKTVSIDIFDAESSDQNFDDAMVNQMMVVQDIFNTGDPLLYAQMIRKYYVDNFSADLDDIDNDTIFKQTTLNRVDFSEFETVFSFGGIEMDEIVLKMNWALAFKQIGVSLTSTGNSESEMVFPDTIQAINSVSNSDVRDFYRDQFIQFNTPHYLLFNETVQDLIKDLAVDTLQHIIAENMAVYNYLVQHLEQDNADLIWAQIVTFKRQLADLNDVSGNVTVRVYNYTNANGVQVEGMNITSYPNASGWANVTVIPDINNLLNAGYPTYVSLVNVYEQERYQKIMAREQAKLNATNATTNVAPGSGTPARTPGSRKLKQLGEKLVPQKKMKVRKSADKKKKKSLKK